MDESIGKLFLLVKGYLDIWHREKPELTMRLGKGGGSVSVF